MLMTQEFDINEELRSSSGKIVKRFGSETFVAVYEQADGEDFDLGAYLKESGIINSIEGGSLPPSGSAWRVTYGHDDTESGREVLIFPKQAWDAFHGMMTRNFDIRAKEHAPGCDEPQL